MRLPFRRYQRLLAAYLRPQWHQLALLMLLLLIAIALRLAAPQLLRAFIDAAQAGDSTAQLARLALAYLCLALLTQGVAVAETYAAETVGWNATNALRADLTRHCLRLDPAFHQRRTPGELLERVDGDVGILANFFSRFVVHILGNVLLLCGVVVLLLREDPRIGLAAGAFAAVTAAAMLRLYARARPLWATVRQTSATFFGFLAEILAAAEDLRSCGAVEHVLRRCRERLDAWRPILLKAVFAEQAVWMVALTLFALANAVALLLGTSLLRRGLVGVGTIYLIFQYVDLLSRPIGEIQGQIQNFQQAGAAIGRVEELFQTRPAVQDGAGGRLPAGPLGVDLDRVSFAYAGSVAPVMHDLTLHLAPGQVLGLLGRTGSGKSTLARLLVRLADPTLGTVRLGGVDLRTTTLADVRQRVGYVTQDVQLFAGTVRDNLTLFNRHIPDAPLLAAIDELGLAEWYHSLPAGLDTALGPQGGLSAGEAQLLALVRVFLKDPGLIILDEASSRLDPSTEARLERALSGLLRGRTAIIIAHRLRTLQRADDLALFEAGRLVEYGPREHLSADSGSRYHHLLQLREGMAEDA